VPFVPVDAAVRDGRSGHEAGGGRGGLASIETETEKKQPVVEQYPLDVWPTFLIVDPGRREDLGRWLGSAA